MQESLTTDGSDVEYVDFVVENPDASGGSLAISESTTRTSATSTSSLGADNVHLASSASPTAWLSSSSFASSSSSPSTLSEAVFPLSGTVVPEPMEEPESAISEHVVYVEDVARAGDEDMELDLETLSDGACTPRQETLNTQQGENHRSLSRTRPIRRHALSSSRVPLNLLRTNPSTVDISPEEDEFRCSTCHHAGLCAELVMQDPTFKCGDTMTTATVAGVRERRGEGGVSARAVEKTPWTGSRIRGVVEPVVVGGREGVKMRVLQGGVDYVRYDDETGSGGGEDERKVADMEDLGRAMEGIRLGSPAQRNDLNDFMNSGSVRSSSSARNPTRPTLPTTLSGRLQRRSWNDIRVEYPPSSSDSTCDSSEDTSATETTSTETETASEESLEVAVATPSFPPVSHFAPRVANDDDLSIPDEPPKIAASSRSRSRARNLWALQNAAVRVLGDGEEEEDERERYDYDDELYGVDVVERGRRRFR